MFRKLLFSGMVIGMLGVSSAFAGTKVYDVIKGDGRPSRESSEQSREYREAPPVYKYKVVKKRGHGHHRGWYRECHRRHHHHDSCRYVYRNKHHHDDCVVVVRPAPAPRTRVALNLDVPAKGEPSGSVWMMVR